MKIYRIPQNLTTIIFDMDGTLYTSKEYLIHQDRLQIARYAQEKGLNTEETQKEFDDFRKNWSETHNGKKISLANTFIEHGVDIQTVFKWRNELADPEDYLKKDEELLKSLKKLEKDYKLVVVTNNSSVAARKTLEAVGIADVLKDVISLDISLVSKPAEHPFRLAAEKKDSRIEQCLSIGDRYDIDIALPLEMGMGGIEVTGASDIYGLSRILKDNSL